MLPCSHACLNDVDNIVAQFFTLAHNIHVHCTHLVGILVVVYVVDVLVFQLCAVVVYFVLDV